MVSAISAMMLPIIKMLSIFTSRLRSAKIACKPENNYDADSPADPDKINLVFEVGDKIPNHHGRKNYSPNIFKDICQQPLPSPVKFHYRQYKDEILSRSMRKQESIANNTCAVQVLAGTSPLPEVCR